MTDTTDTIADALARAQARFSSARKTKTADAGTYRYNYASLDAVIAATRPALSEEGIAVVQSARTFLERKTVAIATSLRRGDEILETPDLELPLARLDVQGIGSVITYGRRYQLSAILGIAAEDDDGAAHAGAPAQDDERESRSAWLRHIHALGKTKGRSHADLTDWAGSHLGIESLREIERSGAAELEAALLELPDVADDARANVVVGGTRPAPGSIPSSSSSLGAPTSVGAGSTSGDAGGGADGGAP